MKLIAKQLRWIGLGGAFGLLLGCTANISDQQNPPLSGVGLQSGGGAAAGGSAAGGVAAGPIDPKTGLPDSCASRTDLAAPAPLARLTNREYDNTLHALFPAASLPATSLPTESKDDGFDNVARDQAPTAVWVEGYFNQATAVAASVGKAVTAACANNANCAGDAVLALAQRVFRKPLADDERTRLRALFDAGSAQWGVQTGAELAVRGMLQTPQFLYRLELGLPAAGKAAAALAPYELASRLSFLLWDSMPDDALFAVAASGALTQPAELETQARRLLAAPAAHPAVAAFHAQWLRFEKMTTLTKSPSLYPGFDDKTAAALRGSTDRFVESAFWEKRTLGNFLTSSTVFANQSLAPLYGVSATTAELTPVDAPAGQRSGILTQAGLLAGFGHETVGSPVLRGVFVLDRLLCAKPAAPPPNVPPPPTADSGGTPTTTRQKFAQHSNSPLCKACHETIDGIGFGFEGYDAIGQFRSTENGLPVDTSGELHGTLDADGTFNGAVELGQRLAQSKQTQACVSRYWYRYAFGLGETDVDACALTPIVKGFQDSGQDLQELVVALIKSSSFRTRPAITP